MIIQPTPKRSSSMPKRGDQNVFANGIRTCPPSANAAKTRSASASLGTVSDREKPWKLGFSEEEPSEAMSVVSPTRKLEPVVCLHEVGNPALPRL